jgi:DNA-binding response OmpR family regulator
MPERGSRLALSFDEDAVAKRTWRHHQLSESRPGKSLSSRPAVRIATLCNDDEEINTAALALIGERNTCDTFSCSRKLISTLRVETYDVLIIDWNIPDGGVLDVISWTRATFRSTPPIIIISDLDSEDSIIQALNAGANDYIIRPFLPSDLLSRINVLLRRSSELAASASGDNCEFPGYYFDLATEMVFAQGRCVPLTPKEFWLALVLFRNLHRALSRAYILEGVWGRNPDLPTRTLDIHISRLRKKLNLRPEHGFRLAPVYSYGYRLERFEPKPLG